MPTRSSVHVGHSTSQVHRGAAARLAAIERKGVVSMGTNLDPTEVVCLDGATRAWHRSPSTSLRGYVFVGRTRVYGNISRFAVDAPFVFRADQSLAGASAIINTTQPA